MRVLLADDQAWLRSAMRLLLEQEPDIEVVGEAGEANVLLSLVGAVTPDLLLLDWELPGTLSGARGECILNRLHNCCPEVAIIVLSGLPESGTHALDAGADYFVSKADPPEALLGAVLNVRRMRTSMAVD
jgi:DNA-binding NarL/FixJ family response regulator